jgi:phenylacetate-coenzyme A ligase PaaK-like adenylate-forming protein
LIHGRTGTYWGLAVAVNQPNKNRVQEQLIQLCEEVRNFISESLLVSRNDSGRFDELAQKIFHFQFEQNGPYRKFCESSGKTPKSVEEFSDIPAMPTSSFKEFELSVLKQGERSRVFHSSGTTLQKASRHFHSEATLKVYEESAAAWFKPFVLPDFEKIDVLSLTPRSQEAPHSSLAHMFETVRDRFGKGSSTFAGMVIEEGWEINLESVLNSLVRCAADNQPVLICGTAFSFVHLCDALDGKQVRLAPGSRVFETGGYKGRSRELPKAELHNLIKTRLGLDEPFIISEYGMSEISSQAYDQKAGTRQSRRFRFPPWARVEVISTETRKPVARGEAGLIRIYDLANVGSVMAVQTEDLGIEHEEGFELLGRAEKAEVRGCSLMQME